MNLRLADLASPSGTFVLSDWQMLFSSEFVRHGPAAARLIAHVCQTTRVTPQPIEQQGFLSFTVAGSSEDLVHAGDHVLGVATGGPEVTENGTVQIIALSDLSPN